MTALPSPDATVNPCRGLSAFPLTPADRDGRVDTIASGGLPSRLAAARVDSVTVLGSTGTYLYLSRELSGLRVMYAAANALDLCRAEPPRPILPLSPADEARVRAALAALAPARSA